MRSLDQVSQFSRTGRTFIALNSLSTIFITRWILLEITQKRKSKQGIQKNYKEIQWRDRLFIWRRECNFYWTNIIHLAVRLYSVNVQMMSKRGEEKESTLPAARAGQSRSQDRGPWERGWPQATFRRPLRVIGSQARQNGIYFILNLHLFSFLFISVIPYKITNVFKNRHGDDLRKDLSR